MVLDAERKKMILKSIKTYKRSLIKGFIGLLNDMSGLLISKVLLVKAESIGIFIIFQKLMCNDLLTDIMVQEIIKSGQLIADFVTQEHISFT